MSSDFDAVALESKATTSRIDYVVGLLPRRLETWINQIPSSRRLMRSAFWTTVGAIAGRMLRIPISVFLARFMGAFQYGEFGVATASVDLFAVFAGFGLGVTATKYVAELRQKDPERAGRIVAVTTVVATVAGIVFSAALFLLAPWLATTTLVNPRLVDPIRIGALVLLFSSINGAQSGALYGFEAYRTVARLLLAQGLLDVVFMCGGFLLGGLNGVVWGMAIARGAYTVVLRRALRATADREGIAIRFEHWRREVRVVWQFSFPAALAGIMIVPVNWVCATLLVRQPHGYAEMGHYNAANQWYNVLVFLPALLGNGLVPILSDRLGNRDTKSSGGILKAMLIINGIIVIPAAVGMSAASRLIMGIYGVDYGTAWPTMIVVVWTAAVMALTGPLADVIVASGRMWFALLFNTIWALVFVSLTYRLVEWGAFGLSTSRLLAYVVQATSMAIFASMILRERTFAEQHSANDRLPCDI